MNPEINDITDRAEDFPDLETGKVKIIVLDGVTGKLNLVTLPEHGETGIQTAKGKGHKVKFMLGEYLL